MGGVMGGERGFSWFEKESTFGRIEMGRDLDRNGLGCSSTVFHG